MDQHGILPILSGAFQGGEKSSVELIKPSSHSPSFFSVPLLAPAASLSPHLCHGQSRLLPTQASDTHFLSSVFPLSICISRFFITHSLTFFIYSIKSFEYLEMWQARF